MQVTNVTIAFVGGGNMAQALIGGLLNTGTSPTRLWVVEPLTSLHHVFEVQGVHVSNTYEQAIKAADVVVLAVKPQILPLVLADIKSFISDKLVISIAAGVTCAAISQGLGGYTRIIRAMPNTPALVQQGATGLFAESHISEEDKQVAHNILASAGLVVWVQTEELMHAVTAVSGSGPAYFFYMMEAMINAAQAVGLDLNTAKTLVLQTALGAAEMAVKSNNSPATLRQNVTSPNGTTAAALAVMDADNMADIIVQAVLAANKRSEVLATS